jgi:hypothetical protein
MTRQIEAGTFLEAVIAVRYPFAADDKACGENNSMMGCTRERGHDGPHVAHGMFTGEYHRPLLMWEAE